MAVDARTGKVTHDVGASIIAAGQAAKPVYENVSILPAVEPLPAKPAQQTGKVAYEDVAILPAPAKPISIPAIPAKTTVKSAVGGAVNVAVSGFAFIGAAVGKLFGAKYGFSSIPIVDAAAAGSAVGDKAQKALGLG